MHIEINAPSNERIKRLIKLQSKSRERKKNQLFVVEGTKEVTFAIENGLVVEELYYSKEKTVQEHLTAVEQCCTAKGLRPQWLACSNNVFSKIAYREGTSEMVGIVKMRSQQLEDLPLGENPLLMVCEGMEKPGNLGALLRTADAAGVSAVIMADAQVDLYNPNAIRSSVGCIFSMPVAFDTSENVIKFLREKGIKIYVTHIEAAAPYYEQDYKGPCAIIAGSEAWGVTDLWAEESDQNIVIPMRGINDSLNVSVAAAVVTFEAVRQRDMK
ncbi:RNA methyltransferase [Persicobacter psychrovividus]|uniref:rRNA methyltransferase n=1 Tax=Persicobacter psychrovividus TaxID=387638 RepID=A0ABN6LEY3_9BACT|nr:rRNA methyltransferase [Persicobacter psychrovividus]